MRVTWHIGLPQLDLLISICWLSCSFMSTLKLASGYLGAGVLLKARLWMNCPRTGPQASSHISSTTLAHKRCSVNNKHYYPLCSFFLPLIPLKRTRVPTLNLILSSLLLVCSGRNELAPVLPEFQACLSLSPVSSPPSNQGCIPFCRTGLLVSFLLQDPSL